MTTKSPLSFSNTLPSSDEKDITIGTRSPTSSSSLHSALTLIALPTSLPTAFPSFNPGLTLHIHARGLSCLSLPLPSSELSIAITRGTPNGATAYTSTRAKRSSGDAVLSREGVNTVATKYFFGPGREPVLTLLRGGARMGEFGFGSDEMAGSEGGETVKVTSRWTSRAAAFTVPSGSGFEWSYACTKDEEGKRVNVLALRVKSLGMNGEGKVIALLLRSATTRTAGSRKSSAGNGGMLVLDEEAEKYIEESLVVATCLLMLKKEMDRRRTVQFAVLAGAAGGGGGS